MKKLVVIPAYNEESTILKVIGDVQKYIRDVVVVDDGSTDNTAKIVNDSKALLVSHPFNLGKGAARETGFAFARSINADIVVTYDADGQFLASDIPKITKPIVKGEADIVLGSRFLGKSYDMSLSRLIVLKLGIIFTHIYSGIKLTDTHIGLRALNKKALNSIKLSQNGPAYASELVDQAVKNKLRIIEIPITVRYTKYSKAKGQKNTSALKIFIDLLLDNIK